MGNVTPPKAVLSTVKIFAVYSRLISWNFQSIYDLKRPLLSNSNQKCNLFSLLFFLIVAFLVNSPGRNKRRQVCKNKFWMSVAKSLEGQERKKIGHEEQLELQWCSYQNQQSPVYDMEWGHFDRVNSTFKMLLSFWNFDTICKKIRSFDAKNLGSVS